MPKYYYPFIVENDENIESYIERAFRKNPQVVYKTSLPNLSLSAHGGLNMLWRTYYAKAKDVQRKHVIAEVEFDSEFDPEFKEGIGKEGDTEVKGQVKKINIVKQYALNREVVDADEKLRHIPEPRKLMTQQEETELKEMSDYYREREPLVKKKPADQSQKTQGGSELPIVDASTIYAGFTRWFARDPLFKKLVTWPFLCSEIDSNAKFWKYTTHLPVQSESTLRHVLYITSFLEGASWAVNKLWLGVMTGLLIHDFVEYYAHPSNRYDNTWQKILLGLSRNEVTLSCNFGSYLLTDYKYWLFISLLMGAPLVTAIGNVIPRIFWHKSLLPQNDSTIESMELYKNLSNESTYWQSTFGFLFPFSTLRLAMDRATFAILQDGRLPDSARAILNDEIIHIAQSHPGFFVQLHALNKLAAIADNYAIEKVSRLDGDVLKPLIEMREKAMEFLRNAARTSSSSVVLDSDDEALNQNSNYTLGSLSQYMYANYLVWSLGQNKKIGWNAFFWLTTLIFKLAAIYASVRIVEAFVFKIMGAWQYVADRDLCRSQGMVWGYIPEWADYYCSHCGDWPFVYVNDRFSQQSCLDGLLAFSQVPAFVLDHIPRLSNVTTIDFSQQFLSNWTLPQWENFLTYFERLPFLQSFNLSQAIYNPYFVDDGRIAALIAFISKVPTAQLILNNLGMGVASVTPLLEGLVNQTSSETLNSLVLSGNPIGDGGANLLSSLLPAFSFGGLILSNVGMSDYGVSQVISALPQARSVTVLDISNNLAGPQTIQTLTAVLQQNPSLQTLIISNNDLSQVDMEPFWQAVCNSSLTRFVAANTNLNDGQLLAAQPYLSRMPIRQYDFSYNPLTDYSVSPFFAGLENTLVEGVDLGYTSITDETYDTISTSVNQTAIHDLGLAGTNPSPDAFVQVARALPSSQVNRIDLSNNFLGDESTTVFAKTLETPGNPLQTIILTNNEITDESGVVLAESATQGNATTIILSDNPISGPTAQAFAKGLPHSSVTTLVLSGCNIDGPGADALIAAKNSPVENLDISNNPITNIGAVNGAQHLITPIPHEDTLGDTEISLDQARAVHAARPNTNLQQINAANTQLNATGAVAWCRSWKSSRRNLQLEPNSFVNLNSVNLQNCQIFPAAVLPSQSLSASQSTALGLSVGVFILLPLAIVGLIALGIVLFRVGKYTAQQLNACTPFWRKPSGISHDSARAEQGQAEGSVNYLPNIKNVKLENRL